MLFLPDSCSNQKAVIASGNYLKSDNYLKRMVPNLTRSLPRKKTQTSRFKGYTPFQSASPNKPLRIQYVLGKDLVYAELLGGDVENIIDFFCCCFCRYGISSSDGKKKNGWILSIEIFTVQISHRIFWSSGFDSAIIIKGILAGPPPEIRG